MRKGRGMTGKADWPGVQSGPAQFLTSLSCSHTKHLWYLPKCVTQASVLSRPTSRLNQAVRAYAGLDPHWLPRPPGPKPGSNSVWLTDGVPTSQGWPASQRLWGPSRGPLNSLVFANHCPHSGPGPRASLSCCWTTSVLEGEHHLRI